MEVDLRIEQAVGKDLMTCVRFADAGLRPLAVWEGVELLPRTKFTLFLSPRVFSVLLRAVKPNEFCLLASNCSDNRQEKKNKQFCANFHTFSLAVSEGKDGCSCV